MQGATRSTMRQAHLERLLAHLQLAQHGVKGLLAALKIARLHHVGDVGCVAHQILPIDIIDISTAT